MGCGISKIDPEAVDGPARGFKRLPKRYNDRASVDASTTSFLPKPQPDVEDVESLDHNFERKSVSSTAAMSANIGKVAGAGAGGDHVVHANKKGDNYEDMTREGGVVREKGTGDNDNNIGHVKVRDGDCHEDERGSISCRDDSIACPGSPSFREYCYSVSKNGRTGKNYHEGRVGAKVDNKSSQGEESLDKVEGQKAKVTKKKSHQASRKPGRSSVRNLFTNAACYNPSDHDP